MEHLYWEMCHLYWELLIFFFPDSLEWNTPLAITTCTDNKVSASIKPSDDGPTSVDDCIPHTS